MSDELVEERMKTEVSLYAHDKVNVGKHHTLRRGCAVPVEQLQAITQQLD